MQSGRIQSYDNVMRIAITALSGNTYLSSKPPSFLTIFRNENTVPKTNFASSSALSIFIAALVSVAPLPVAVSPPLPADDVGLEVGFPADTGAL